MSKSQSQAKLISKYNVRPDLEVESSKIIYHLAPLELTQLSTNPIKLGFLFSKPNNYSSLNHIIKLKSSLSQALVQFYPLAGQLVTTQYKKQHSCSIHIDCSKGPGAKLIHAAALPLTIADIASRNRDVPVLSVRSFFDMGETSINHDGHNRAMLSVQLTDLADGIVLGFTANHCVMDGTSLINFIKVWSQIFMGSITSCSANCMDCSFRETVIKLPYLEPHEFIVRSRSTNEDDVIIKERFFNFSIATITKLKAKANAEANVSSISSLQALVGFAWKCITRVRRLHLNEVTTCALVVNLRSRFDPPLPDDHFGCYLGRVKGVAIVGELLENNVGWAALLLNKALVALDQDKVVLYPKVLRSSKVGSHSNHVVVAGSPRFDYHTHEFGVGKPVGYVGGLSNKWDGKLYAHVGMQGPGSVELEICLADETMTALSADEEFMSFVSQPNEPITHVSRI